MGVEIYVNFRARVRQNGNIIRTKKDKIMKYTVFYGGKNVDCAAYFKTR
jgi:hypothetical protein